MLVGWDGVVETADANPAIIANGFRLEAAAHKADSCSAGVSRNDDGVAGAVVAVPVVRQLGIPASAS